MQPSPWAQNKSTLSLRVACSDVRGLAQEGCLRFQGRSPHTRRRRDELLGSVPTQAARALPPLRALQLLATITVKVVYPAAFLSLA